jgi:hypothetical protein
VQDTQRRDKVQDVESNLFNGTEYAVLVSLVRAPGCAKEAMLAPRHEQHKLDASKNSGDTDKPSEKVGSAFRVVEGGSKASSNSFRRFGLLSSRLSFIAAFSNSGCIIAPSVLAPTRKPYVTVDDIPSNASAA